METTVIKERNDWIEPLILSFRRMFWLHYGYQITELNKSVAERRIPVAVDFVCQLGHPPLGPCKEPSIFGTCLLYTSDAADE